MSDNTQLNAGTGGDTIATDDIGGVKYQRVKANFGADGVAIDVSSLNPFPVSVRYADSPAIDAFGRLRVSEPHTLFDSKQIEEMDTSNWANKIVNNSGNAAIAFNNNQASVSLTVGANNGDRAVRQSRRRINYQPGKSIMILCTGILGTQKTNVTQRIGYFDDNNGLFFEQTGTSFSVVKRSRTSGSVVDTAVAQSSWNLDKMNGTGTSGVSIDTTKSQIFVIDFEWLGVGRIRYGFVINGLIIYCHETNHANSTNVVYMSTPNLPVRYEILNTDSTLGATTLTQICSTVLSEGGYNPEGTAYSADRGITATGTINTTLTPVISIRLKSTRLTTAVGRFGFSIFAGGTTTYRWALMLNPTITGGTAASWVSASTAIEKDVSRTGSVSGGTILASGYADGNLANQIIEQIDSINVLGSDVDGVADEIVLAVQTTTSADPFYGSIAWREAS
jgi:hypothetical protein